jgi:hypothetical protein
MATIRLINSGVFDHHPCGRSARTARVILSGNVGKLLKQAPARAA